MNEELTQIFNKASSHCKELFMRKAASRERKDEKCKTPLDVTRDNSLEQLREPARHETSNERNMPLNRKKNGLVKIANAGDLSLPGNRSNYLNSMQRIKVEDKQLDAMQMSEVFKGFTRDEIRLMMMEIPAMHNLARTSPTFIKHHLCPLIPRLHLLKYFLRRLLAVLRLYILYRLQTEQLARLCFLLNCVIREPFLFFNLS
jgi:hypothetical protein